MDLRPEISVVIPCYNEEENVREIHEAVRREIEPLASSYEIIFIDNASTDQTRSYLREICAADPHSRAIFNNRNYGQMRSPTYAIYQAEGQAVIAMCADFQDPPAMIGPMIAQWRAGAQVVLGQRRSERASIGTRLSRLLGYALLGRFADYRIIPGATGFGLFDRACIDALAAWHEPEPFFRGMVIESGFRLSVLPFDRPARAAGVTKNNVRELVRFGLSGLSGSAKGLLRAPLVLSAYVAAIGLLLLLATFGAALFGRASSLLLLLTVQTWFAAAMFFFTGLIGDQVRLISERSRGVPLVIEEERIGFPPERERPAMRSAVKPLAAFP